MAHARSPAGYTDIEMQNGHTHRVTLGARGQVTIPARLRHAAGLEQGAPLDIELTKDGILLHVNTARDPGQWWFWTPEWQRMEREADEQEAAGQLNGPMTGEEFLASLEALCDAPAES